MSVNIYLTKIRELRDAIRAKPSGPELQAARRSAFESLHFSAEYLAANRADRMKLEAKPRQSWHDNHPTHLADSMSRLYQQSKLRSLLLEAVREACQRAIDKHNLGSRFQMVSRDINLYSCVVGDWADHACIMRDITKGDGNFLGIYFMAMWESFVFEHLYAEPLTDEDHGSPKFDTHSSSRVYDLSEDEAVLMMALESDEHLASMLVELLDDELGQELGATLKQDIAPWPFTPTTSPGANVQIQDANLVDGDIDVVTPLPFALVEALSGELAALIGERLSDVKGSWFYQLKKSGVRRDPTTFRSAFEQGIGDEISLTFTCADESPMLHRVHIDLSTMTLSLSSCDGAWRFNGRTSHSPLICSLADSGGSCHEQSIARHYAEALLGQIVYWSLGI